jgi:ferric-dicitrate binding protein FerR (iron transport regulator)
MDYKNLDKRYIELAEKWLNGTITRDEEIEFSNWYNINQDKEVDIPKEFAENEEMLRKRILQNILDVAKNEENAQRGKVIQLRQKNKLFPLVRIAVAASIIGLLILGSYFWVKKDKENEVAKTQVEAKPYKEDVLPGGNKAILTLADGSTILLDDAQNGALAQQGGTKVIKLGGKLSYSSTGADVNEILYNTLSTPHGGQYQIELPDGTQIWLNAASSLRFPTAFAGKERRVEITGEAYFEVVRNKNIPFIVSVNGAEVQVLGTHFNVMAYTEEDAIKTTLLEGSVYDYDRAAVNLKRAVDLGSTDPRPYYYTAVLLTRESGGSKWLQIRSLLRKALELDQNHADALALLAFAEVSGGDTTEAIRWIKQSIALSPRNDGYRLDLAKYMIADKRGEAAKSLLAYLANSEDQKVASESSALLKQIETVGVDQYAAEKRRERENPMAYVDPRWRPKSGGGTISELEEKKPVAGAKPDMRKTEFLKGRIVKVACSEGAGASVTLAAAGKTWTMKAKDRDKLVLIGADQFSCGWANVRVAVNYKASGANKGDLVSLELQ